MSPNPSGNPVTPYEGCFDTSVRRQVNSSFAQQLFGSGVPVSLTNPTAATDMMTFTVQPGTLSVPGQALEIYGAGTYSLGVASTLVFTIKLGGVTLATFTTTSNATTAVTLSWNLLLTVTVNAALTLESHGFASVDLGATLAAAASTFNDSNIAAITGVNLGNSNLLEIMSNVGTGNAASNITQRQGSILLYN